jgi:hypothetical protein
VHDTNLAGTTLLLRRRSDFAARFHIPIFFSVAAFRKRKEEEKKGTKKEEKVDLLKPINLIPKRLMTAWQKGTNMEMRKRRMKKIPR